MNTHTGYFLIADISGYTAYLTQSEMDHANPILRSLLEALMMQIGEPLHLWRMEGDAVLAYSTSRGFPSGETFLTICENLYQAFTTRKLDIIQHTTCPCKACANVSGLDLKIMAHHGQFEEIKIGPMTDISGADVILVHRMAKTDVKEVTGIHSYALFSEAAYQAMGIETELLQYQAWFEYFGDVPMRVYDLARAWEKHRASAAVVRVEDDEAVYTFRHFLAASSALSWELLTAPKHKQKWMEMRSVNHLPVEGRMVTGTRFHCIHEMAEFHYHITDWRPFRYFSTSFADPMHRGHRHAETYEVEPAEGGVYLNYRMGPLLDENGVRQEAAEAELVEVYKDFWSHTLVLLDAMIANM